MLKLGTQDIIPGVYMALSRMLLLNDHIGGDISGSVCGLTEITKNLLTAEIVYFSMQCETFFE